VKLRALHIIFGLALTVLLPSCKKEKVNFDFIQIESGTDLPLRSIVFNVNGDAFVGGGERFETGQIWTIESDNCQLFSTPNSQGLFDLHFLEDDLIACATDGKMLNISQPNWSVLQISLPDYGWKPVLSLASTNKYLVGVGGEGFFLGFIAKFNLDDYSFNYQLFDQQLFDIQMVDENVGYTCGFGLVVKTVDGGETWKTQNISGDIFKALHFIDAQNGWVVGDEGSIWQTKNGGASWTKSKKTNGLLGKKYHWNDVLMLNLNEIWLAGEESIWQSIDGGENWRILDEIPNCQYNAIAHQNDNIYAVGNNGCITKIMPY